MAENGCIIAPDGAVAELADAADLKSAGGNTVRVRPPLAPQIVFIGRIWLFTLYIGALGKRNILESPLCVEFLKSIFRMILIAILKELFSESPGFSYYQVLLNSDTGTLHVC